MALFGKKKKGTDTNAPLASTATSESPSAKTAEKSVAKETLSPGRDLASVIVRPRITEKAVLGTDKNIYTFEVRKNATKHDVRDAIRAVYNVTPRKINIVNRQPRHYNSRLRGRSMLQPGMRKAYIYLKEGDRIDLV